MVIYRVILDRGSTPWDSDLEELDFSSSPPGPSRLTDLLSHIKNNRM